jgi:FkbM family methyltransferase
MKAIEDLLLFDPFLTLQMGHFVRAPVARSVRFDESLDAGEDFDYYLRLWSDYRCTKVAREFFINRHARRSTGPRSASAEDWGTAVRSRQRAARERRGLAPESAMAREISNARSAELQRFCCQHGLVSAQECIALSKQMPFYGDLEVNEYEGGSFVLHTENDDAICAQLAWCGEYQPFAAALWQTIAATCGTIVDAGAGNGFYGLLAARVAPQARILCLEPVAENGARLRLNAEQNGARSIELIEAVASDSDGKAYLRVQSADAMLPLKVDIGTTPGRSVQCLRIDNYISRIGVDAVGLVRISSETNVVAVLHGMGQTLTAQHPDLLVDLTERTSADSLVQTLRRHGYRCYTVDNVNRELRPLDPNPAYPTEGELQVLASARPPADIRRIAANALGRLIDA